MAGKGIGTPENKTAAFEVYCEFGGKNFAKIAETIKERLGFPLSEQTLRIWATAGDWNNRLSRRDALTKGIDESGLSVTEIIRGGLLERVKAYQTYFRSLGGAVPPYMDIFAYVGVVNAALKLEQKPDEAKALSEIEDAEVARQRADEIVEQEYGIKRG